MDEDGRSPRNPLKFSSQSGRSFRLERGRNEIILGQVLGGSGVALVAGCGPLPDWLPADGCGLVAACGLVSGC
jgi:hypothetical protein